MKNGSNIDYIRDIVNKYDPIGLLAGGAPEDEYEQEVVRIANILRYSEDDLTEKIYQVFAKQFSEEIVGDISNYRAIADELLR